MTDICSPTILQARVWNLSWNQDCWQGCTQPESLGEDPCFASFSIRWLPALSDLWPHHPSLCLCCHAVSFSSVSASNCPPPPFFVRMCVIALTAHPNNPRWSPNLKILNPISKDPYSVPNKVKCAGSRPEPHLWAQLFSLWYSVLLNEDTACPSAFWSWRAVFLAPNHRNPHTYATLSGVFDYCS